MKHLKQTWKHTWFEVTLNIVVGYLISVVGNWIYLWAIGNTLSFWEINGLGMFMTLLSVCRQVVMRRFFEYLRIKHLISSLIQEETDAAPSLIKVGFRKTPDDRKRVEPER